MGRVPHGAGHGGPWGSATTVRYLLVWKGRGRQGRRGGQAEEDNALLNYDNAASRRLLLALRALDHHIVAVFQIATVQVRFKIRRADATVAYSKRYQRAEGVCE